jgi:hypothetical protein
MEEEAPPQAAGKQRKRSGLASGLFWYKDGKRVQARIKQLKEGKMVQIDRPIPGIYADETEALVAQATAQRKWNCGEVVWAKDPAERNKRGQVCRQPALLCAMPAHLA